MIKINNHDDVKVTGVYEDLPMNTEFRKDQFIAPFELWLSGNSWIQKAAQDWTNHFLHVYAEIKPAGIFAKSPRRSKMPNAGMPVFLKMHLFRKKKIYYIP